MKPLRTREESTSRDEPASKTFTVGRSHSKKFCKALSTSLKPAEARAIRKHYEPKFLKSSVNRQCPKIDHSIARRMGERKEKQEVAKVEHKEKSLVSMHFKVLDSASPLLFIAESLAAENARTCGIPVATLYEAYSVATRPCVC